MVRVHRWLSLAAALFWLIQAVTGVLIVFHWEFEDAGLGRAHRATDLVAIGRRLDQLAPPGSNRSIVSVWTSAGLPDRYDVTVSGSNGESSVRIDGGGTVLRRIDPDEQSMWDTVVIIHHNLLASDAGSWIVGVSGVLLLSNILLGLWTAWPRPRGWRLALRPPGAQARRPARLYGWHRALGLWAAVPALLLAGAGVLLVFEDAAGAAIGALPALPTTPAPVVQGPALPFASIARIALARYPGATLTAVIFPGGDAPNWKVRVRQLGELRRAYGTTALAIARDGRVLADADATRAPWNRAFMDSLFAVHTGEAAGLFGRLAVLATGLWLATMIVLGVLLWSVRRKKKGRSS